MSLILITLINYGIVPGLLTIIVFLMTIFRNFLYSFACFLNLDRLDNIIQYYCNPKPLQFIDNQLYKCIQYIFNKEKDEKINIIKNNKKETLDDFIEKDKQVKTLEKLLNETYQLPDNDEDATIEDVQKLVSIVGKLSDISSKVIYKQKNK